MDTITLEKVLNHDAFKSMEKKKRRLSWIFSILTILVYFSFIGFIGISPETFSEPVSMGASTTWGIYIGLFVILFAIAITGVYVYKANGEFDQLTRQVIEDVAPEQLKGEKP